MPSSGVSWRMRPMPRVAKHREGKRLGPGGHDHQGQLSSQPQVPSPHASQHPGVYPGCLQVVPRQTSCCTPSTLTMMLFSKSSLAGNLLCHPPNSESTPQQCTIPPKVSHAPRVSHPPNSEPTSPLKSSDSLFFTSMRLTCPKGRKTHTGGRLS